MKIKHLASILITIVFVSAAYSQTNDLKTIEAGLCNDFKKLIESSRDMDFEKKDILATKITHDFRNAVKNNTASLNYKFSRLIDSGYCHIITSDDGLLRFYSWNTELGGTMQEYDEIIQYKSNSFIYTLRPVENEVDPGCFYSKVFTVKINNQSYYLVISNRIYSSKDILQSIQIYIIENGKLIKDRKLFKANNKTFDHINVNFDFFSVVDRPERPVEVIKYDKQKQIVYIAVVLENGKVTNKNILYQLKDNQFEFIGIK